MKSQLLYQAKLALREKGLNVEIGSIKELKELFPVFKDENLNLGGLKALLDRIPDANLDEWMHPPKKIRTKWAPIRRLLTKSEMHDLRSKGCTLQAIANKSGISRERVRQILTESRLEN